MNQIFLHVKHHREPYTALALVYGTLVSVSFFYNTYQDGKAGLAEYRRALRHHGQQHPNEFAAIKSAMSCKMFNNLFNAIVVPFSFATDIFPYVIIKLNPDPRKAE